MELVNDSAVNVGNATFVINGLGGLVDLGGGSLISTNASDAVTVAAAGATRLGNITTQSGATVLGTTTDQSVQ